MVKSIKHKKGGKRKTKKIKLRKKNRVGGQYSKLAKKTIIKNAAKYPKVHVARFENIDPKDLITKRTVKVYPKSHPGRYGGGKKTKRKRRKRRRKHKKKRTKNKSRRKRRAGMHPEFKEITINRKKYAIKYTDESNKIGKVYDLETKKILFGETRKENGKLKFVSVNHPDFSNSGESKLN